MSVRTRYSIVKGVNQEIANQVIAEATKLFPKAPLKPSKSSDWIHVAGSQSFDAFVSADMLVITNDAWTVAKEIARIVDAPHLELRVQESDHWDFSLFHHDALVADFSTRVAYFNDDPTSPRPWKLGSAEIFANIWGISKEKIQPYLVDWNALPCRRACREGDKYPTDDWRQVFDFMSALGIDQPDNHRDSFAFAVPSWEIAHVRQPAWRRAIRLISDWITGTYPAAPQPTVAEKKDRERRHASVQIDKLDIDEVINRDRTKRSAGPPRE